MGAIGPIRRPYGERRRGENPQEGGNPMDGLPAPGGGASGGRLGPRRVLGAGAVGSVDAVRAAGGR